VAAVYGVDPLLYLVGSQGFPKNISEYEFAGGICGSPIEVVKGEVTGLPIPANAEIVVEGFSHPDATRNEGPFGEFQGYYGRPEANTPLMDIQCVHYRNDPILTSALMADYPSCEQNYFFSIIRSAKIWDDLDTLGIPGIKGVYSHPAAAGGFGVVVVSMEQRHAGHAPQVLALTAQCPAAAYYTKWIITVDEDVDPTNMDEVLWAMTTRCSPADDIDILRNTWSTYLDPTKNPPEERPYGSKALINACKEHRHLDVFSKRSVLRKSMYESVKGKWDTLGLDFPPPVLTSFEPEKE
jgi:4-hydroxy-3-polyprenylbenzoate decarboxylase